MYKVLCQLINSLFVRLCIFGGLACGIELVVLYNYPTRRRWIVVDIYRDAKRRGIYPPLFTDPEGDSCFSIYQIRWIKKNASWISSSKTFAKRHAIFLSVRKTVNIQGYSELREPIKTLENCYPLIWQILIHNKAVSKVFSLIFWSLWSCKVAIFRILYIKHGLEFLL